MKNYVFIKLFIGLVLFGTLVAMRVLGIVDADIKNLCLGGLMGLGIMHLGGGSTSDPVDKQGGFAAPLALIIAAGVGVILAACTSVVPQSSQEAYTQSCAAYNVARDVVTELRAAGKLSQSQIDQLALIPPLCTGPVPAEPEAEVAKVIATVAVLEAMRP